jgi:predicted histidine transporter YuiF (NhaC family)
MANAKSSGISFSGLLTILFIGLKLTNTIDWSWFWVLSPIFLPITLLIIVGIIWGIYEAYKKAKKIERAKEEIKKIDAKNNSKWATTYQQVLETQKKIEEMKKK